MRALPTLLLLLPSLALAGEAPPLYQMALPANVVFVAYLPVLGARGADLFDLDLRTEVVLPMSCGDRVAGLLKHEGPRLDGDDLYDVVVERRPVATCKKDASRIGARSTVRMRLLEGKPRELLIGSRALQVLRKGTVLTVDGQEPAGDVPGAPASLPAATLVEGEVLSVRLGAVERLEPTEAGVSFELVARWPRCAGAPLGLLGRGDASTRFALEHFTPLALAPLDGSCTGKGGRVETVDKKSTVRATLNIPKQDKPRRIKLGAHEVTVEWTSAPAR